MQTTARRLGKLAQRFVEQNLTPPSRPSVLDRPLRYGDGEHLFEAQCLCAELHTIRFVRLGFAALVLDGEWPARAVGSLVRLKLYHVGFPDETKTERAQCETADDAQVAACFIRALVRLAMEVLSFDRESVFRPQTFDVDERALALAEEEVLERRDGKESVFGEHVCRWESRLNHSPREAAARPART